MKKAKIFLIVLLTIFGIALYGNVYADTETKTRNLSISEHRPYSDDNKNGTVGDDTYYYLKGKYSLDKGYTIFKIHEQDDTDYSESFYCLRGGVGFGATSETDVSKGPVAYTEIGEMHKNANEIIEKYKNNYDNVDLNRTVNINDKQVNIYNAILWILDEAYLPVDGNNYSEAEYKQELFDKIGIPNFDEKDETHKQEAVTKDDIEVIQQLAIWYFANYDEQDKNSNNKPTLSQNTKTPASFLTINESNNIEQRRVKYLNEIYQYFINNAIENSSNYNTTGDRSKAIATNKFDKNLELKIVSENVTSKNPDIEYGDEYSFYKIGPFSIRSDVSERAGNELSLNNIILCDAEGKTVSRYHYVEVTNLKPEENDSENTTHLEAEVVYYFVDESGKEVTKIEKGTNKKYYIMFSKSFEKNSNSEDISEEEKYDMSSVSLKVASSYSLSTATFLIKESTDQPVVEIEKEKKSEGDEISTKQQEEFDLSLRKFITAIKRGDTDIKVESRIPQIDTTTLINGITNRDGTTEYTATYKHPKNALRVKTDDIVTYTIRVYNEGEADGTATQVTDYLPSGLELVSNSSINNTYGWTEVNGVDGRKIIKTTYLNDATIKAFNQNATTGENLDSNGKVKWQKASTGSGGLYYADLQVECKVIASSDSTDESLRNIAAITEDNGVDRDSVPGQPNLNEYNPPTDDNSTYQEDDDDYEDLVLPGEEFDLALRKYITGVFESSDRNIEDRIPDADITPLIQGETTANYKHKKDPVEVEIGNIVKYAFRVYNEGNINGVVTSIVDYLPKGLTFDEADNSKFIQYKESYSEGETEGKEYAYKLEGNKLTILPIEGDNLFEIEAFNGEELKYETIEVNFKVTASDSNEDQILTNVATMTYKPVGAEVADRDSKGEEFTEPTAEKLLEGLPGYKGNEENKDELNDSNYHYKGQQDDDDFEKIKIKGKTFDLSLRKFISSIKRNGEEVEFDSRVPKIDTTTLINGTFNRNGKLENTATYEHSKEPLVVKKGDIITYTLRIYNEGQRDGYATEITDYIPEGLALILNYNTNYNNIWKLNEDLENDKTIPLIGEEGFYKTEEDVTNLKIDDFEGITSLKDVKLVTGELKITSNLLDDELIKAFDKDKTELEDGWQKAEKGDGGLYYKDIQVSCLVVAENSFKDTITNIAEISQDKDENKNDVDDDDSIPNDKKDPYDKQQEDDDDYEPVVLKCFDLALRKFITGVDTNGKMKDVTSRIPNPKMGEDGNIVYEHSKDPVYVATNDIVIYTIRVFNEGTVAGYAEEITDDIPDGLMYLPEHNTNRQYEWVMIDKDGKVTENVEEAVKITTDYLSQAKENAGDETEGRTNLINPFDNSKPISTEEPFNPDYKDVKVAFKVSEPNTSDRIITNSAQISKDSDDDIDSTPDEWNDGEDDQDKEHIYVKYFDLSLLKWVTETIVTVDGKTTTTETGFKPNTGKTETTGIRDNNASEPIAKVEIDRKKLNSTTVKFVYKIRVTNEGEIAGYASEITDFIPEGLEFLEEDNKAYGWTKDGDNKVTTRALETVLLQPGQSAEVEIIFTWKKSTNNLGVKTNIAEITEDYNEHSSKDIDSTPDNKKDPYEKEQEDDDDFALVILSIKTGKGMSYTIFIVSMITLLTIGLYAVKKYVLDYKIQ